MLNILIVDDHPIVRQGLKQILSDLNQPHNIDEAETTAEMLRLARQVEYSFVLLDINLPDRSGLDALPDFKAIRPTTPVLILSMFPERQYAIRAIKAGASGYLTKESATDELLIAINKVLSGGKYISAALAESFLDFLDSGSSQTHSILSLREFEVMICIAQGKGAKEIAECLHISEKTVSTYRTRILEKMDFDSTADIVKYAINENLVQ